MNVKNLVPAAAAILLAATIVSCNKDQSKSTSAPAPATSAKTAGETIVFVNQDSLLSKYEYAKDVTSNMQEQGRKAQVDLTAKGNAYQQEVAAYQKGYATMSADQRAATEDRLRRKQGELQSLDQNAQTALANEQMANNNKLYDKVTAFLKTYAKNKGYKMVISYSRANPSVLFGDESLDVTNDVLAGLNADYKKEKP